jgi:hypothetical protein
VKITNFIISVFFMNTPHYKAVGKKPPPKFSKFGKLSYAWGSGLHLIETP